MKENETLKTKTITALFYSFGGFIITASIQFISTIILARLLLPEDYGLIGMIMIFIALSQIFVESGMTMALIREENPSEEDYSTVFYYNLFLSFVMYLFLFVSADTISVFFNEPLLVPIIRVIGLNLCISSFGLIQRTMLVIKLDFKTQMKVEIVSAVVSGVVAIYMAYNGFGVWSLVIQLLIRQIIISAMFIIYNKWIPKLVFKIDSFKRLFGFGWKMLVTGILATIYNNIYNIIIGRVYLSTQLGYYTKSIQLRDLAANSITVALEKVSYPVLSKVQDNRDQFRSNFRKIIKATSYITFPIMIGMTAVAEPFINILLGQNWTSMVPYFQILCLAGLTYPHRALNLNILKVVGRSDLFLKLDIIKMLIGSVSIGIVIFLDLGIYGLLWTSFINTQIAFFINSYFSKKYISYSTGDQIIDMTKSLAISILMGVIVYITGYMIPFQSYTSLLIQIIIGIISYIAFSKSARVEELNTIIDIIEILFVRVKERVASK